MKISLVIIQHNFGNFTKSAVDSIFDNTVVPDEVIVIDNASNWSNTRWMMEDDRIKPVYLGKNYCYIGATNIGWRLSSGDVIILCNNDITLAKDCIKNLTDSLFSEENIGWLSACYTKGPWENCLAGVPKEISNLLDRSNGEDRENFNKWSETLPSISISHSSPTEATVFAVKKRISDEVGQFRTDMNYNHTHDYCLRLQEKGYSMAVCPSAVFWHNDNHMTLSAQSDYNLREELHKADAIMDSIYGETWRNLR